MDLCTWLGADQWIGHKILQGVLIAHVPPGTGGLEYDNLKF